MKHVKKNKEWSMCVDYTNLNKACKKDPFELPQIDQVVDSTIGYNILNFIDRYSGYHQIPLKVEDHIKTSFITPFGAFYYITMPFRLKSVGHLIKGVYNSVYTHSLGVTWKHMWTTWLPKLGKKRDSFLTWQRPSTTRGNSK
jgi:hypothetical protein